MKSKYFDTMVDILEGQFPKRECKERGRALVMLAYIEMMLNGTKFNEEGVPLAEEVREEKCGLSVRLGYGVTEDGIRIPEDGTCLSEKGKCFLHDGYSPKQKEDCACKEPHTSDRIVHTKEKCYLKQPIELPEGIDWDGASPELQRLANEINQIIRYLKARE